MVATVFACVVELEELLLDEQPTAATMVKALSSAAAMVVRRFMRSDPPWVGVRLPVGQLGIGIRNDVSAPPARGAAGPGTVHAVGVAPR
jgi:hypothetical protein